MIDRAPRAAPFGYWLVLCCSLLAACTATQRTGVPAADEGACRIVVLGSSTAAGIGPTHPDSSWVRRFARALSEADAGVEVVNLAHGGYTTYHLLPTGTNPSTHPAPDTARNITAALALAPAAVIINLPSNDAARNTPVVQQLANYDRLLVDADARDVPVYLTTPQPRNFAPAQIALQRQLLDSTYAHFGPEHTIDFWTPLVTGAGSIRAELDSGDGVHVNDAAHRLLSGGGFGESPAYPAVVRVDIGTLTSGGLPQHRGRG